MEMKEDTRRYSRFSFLSSLSVSSCLSQRRETRLTVATESERYVSKITRRKARFDNAHESRKERTGEERWMKSASRRKEERERD